MQTKTITGLNENIFINQLYSTIMSRCLSGGSISDVFDTVFHQFSEVYGIQSLSVYHNNELQDDELYCFYSANKEGCCLSDGDIDIAKLLPLTRLTDISRQQLMSDLSLQSIIVPLRNQHQTYGVCVVTVPITAIQVNGLMQSLQDFSEIIQPMIKHIEQGVMLDALLQSTNSVFLLIRELKVIRQFAKTENIFGHSRQSMMRKDVASFVHPDDRFQIEDLYQGRMDGRIGNVQIDMRLRHGDGHYFPARIDINTVSFQGKVSTLLAITDLSPLKVIECTKEASVKAIALEQAIDTDQLQLYYQLQIIREGRQNRLAGVEALARWRDPVFGDVSPEEFIPIAEQYGLIHKLGLWAIKTGCTQVCEWNAVRRAKDLVPLSVSINVSGRQFNDPHFVDNVLNIVHTSGIEPDLLHLEITESQLVVHLKTLEQAMRRFRKAGLKIEIDDFGTGESSLNRLSALIDLIDIIKIDQSFVQKIYLNSPDMQIIKVIVGLARILGKDVIAEGVETPSQLKSLMEIGCNHIQGFLFSHPAAAMALAELIKHDVLCYHSEQIQDT